MANDLNSCNFIGRLGRDPETKYLPNGDAVTNFSIAVGESWKDKASGEKKEVTEWVNCVAFRKLGEICGEWLKKGSQIYIGGKMKTRTWEKEGQKHYRTEIILENMQMLGGKSERNSADDDHQQPRERAAPAEKKPAGKFDDMEDDIPF